MYRAFPVWSEQGRRIFKSNDELFALQCGEGEERRRRRRGSSRGMKGLWEAEEEEAEEEEEKEEEEEEGKRERDAKQETTRDEIKAQHRQQTKGFESKPMRENCVCAVCMCVCVCVRKPAV
jgi:FtsZ-interacting cell division protein YlmF